jgi:hypothetical protein
MSKAAYGNRVGYRLTELPMFCVGLIFLCLASALFYCRVAYDLNFNVVAEMTGAMMVANGVVGYILFSLEQMPRMRTAAGALAFVGTLIAWIGFGDTPIDPMALTKSFIAILGVIFIATVLPLLRGKPVVSEEASRAPGRDTTIAQEDGVADRQLPQNKADVVAWLRARAQKKRDFVRHAEDNRDDWFGTMPPEISADALAEAEWCERAADLLARA